jgi:hypothetical protein
MNVRTFDTAAELFDYLDELYTGDLEALEKSSIKPEQLPVGQCFVRLYPVGPRETLVIFGEVERSKYEEDWPLEDDARKRGYVFGTCYSVMCPEGELGSTHVGNIHLLISRSTFETAKSNGWRHLEQTN